MPTLLLSFSLLVFREGCENQFHCLLIYFATGLIKSGKVRKKLERVQTIVFVALINSYCSVLKYWDTYKEQIFHLSQMENQSFLVSQH